MRCVSVVSWHSMNYLAHFLLSGQNPEHQVGALLGDFVKGPLESLQGDLPNGIVDGIRLHRALDAHCDHNPMFTEASLLLDTRFRRFSGIMLDIYFDHLLASYWQHFHADSLEQYAQQIYQSLELYSDYLSPAALQFFQRMRRYNLLLAYRETTTIEQVLKQISNRLRVDNPLHLAYDALRSEHRQLEEIFLQDFPSLHAWSRDYQQQLSGSTPQE